MQNIMESKTNSDNPPPQLVRTNHNGVDSPAGSRSDGRITAKQEVIQIRANQPSREAPIGEFLDNSKCWGRARGAGIVFTQTSIVGIDDGTFKSKESFSKMWTKTKSGDEPRYEDTDDMKLGKYNAGATDSVISLGNTATAFHNFNGSVLKNDLDLSRYQRDNLISPSAEPATDEERKDFIKYMKLVDPLWTLESNRGSVIKIDNLVSRNTKTTIDKVFQFTKALYIPDKNSFNIGIFNWLKDDWPATRTATHIISPIDITFGALVIMVHVNVYLSDDGELKHVVKEETDKIPVFKYSIQSWVLNETQRIAEQAYYGNTSDQERVGFSVYRAGRRITASPHLWGLSTGMSRAKGIRFAVFIGATDKGDEIFGVGTQKLVTDTSWSHFDPSMKELFKKEFNDAQKLVKKHRTQIEKKWINKYVSKLNIIEDLSVDDIQTELESAKNEGKVGPNETIRKKNGKVYDAWKNYYDALKNREEAVEEAVEEDVEEAVEEALRSKSYWKKRCQTISAELEKERSDRAECYLCAARIGESVI